MSASFLAQHASLFEYEGPNSFPIEEMKHLFITTTSSFAPTNDVVPKLTVASVPSPRVPVPRRPPTILPERRAVPVAKEEPIVVKETMTPRASISATLSRTQLIDKVAKWIGPRHVSTMTTHLPQAIQHRLQAYAMLDERKSLLKQLYAQDMLKIPAWKRETQPRQKA